MPVAVAAIDATSIWDRTLELVSGSASQTAVVEMFELKSIGAGVAMLGVVDLGKLSFAKSKTAWMSELLTKVAGTPIRAELSGDIGVSGASGGPGGNAGPSGGSSGPSSGGTSSSRPPTLSVEAESALRRQAAEQPLVKRAMELFNARIVSVEDDQRE